MVEFVSLKDYVYEYISNEISSGALELDKKIDERKICEELNISRTPVREALLQLATEGYIENIPRKGFVIRKLGEKEAKDLYQVLGLLDGFAATEVCGKLDEKDFKNMDFFIDSMDIAIEKENYEMYYRQQEEFHDVYLNKLENETMKNLIQQVKKRFLKKKYVIPTEISIMEILLETNNDHRKILRFFKEGEKNQIFDFMKNVHWDPSKVW